MINLVSCNQCNVQHVCETTLPLHERINLYRRTQSGVKYVIKDVYSVQIIEVFTGTGHNFNKVCPVNSKTRLDREDYWIETLQTSYHYGLD